MCGQNPSLEDFSWSDIVEAEVQIRLQQVEHTQSTHTPALQTDEIKKTRWSLLQIFVIHLIHSAFYYYR